MGNRGFTERVVGVEDRIIGGVGVKEMKDQSFERGITYVDVEISRN